ncbi:MAG: polysaccharide deacetylase family protein [Campylobacterales bacterium]
MRVLAAFALTWCYLAADAAVLVYHRFDDARFPSTSISTERMREDFKWLKDNGYRVVPLKEVIESVKNRRPIDRKTVALTIDDGYKSFYESGLGVFKEFGYPFTVFAYVEATHDAFADFMSWEQLREVAEYGSVQLHTYSHPHLTRLGSQALKAEIEQAKTHFEQNMGYPAEYVAYPFGEYNAEVRQAHEAAGFSTLLNYNGGMIGHTSDLGNLDRVGVTGKWPIKSLVDRYALEAEWEGEIVQNNRIGTIRATFKNPIDRVLLVVTGYPDRWVDVQDGHLEVKVDQPFKNSRTLIALKDGKGGITTRLIMQKE